MSRKAKVLDVDRPRARGSRGFSLVEIIVGSLIFSVLLGLAVSYLGFGRRTEKRITSRLGAQQTTRKALVRFLRELQECMEVLSPKPGSTLSYALVRDQINLVRWYFQVPDPASDPTDPTYQVWRFVDDPELAPDQRQIMLLSGVRRLTFTSRSEGALQLNLTVTDASSDGDRDHDFATLLTVRLRNLPAAEEVW